MQSALDVLRAIDDKLSSKDKWTQKNFARNSNGEPVGPKDNCAVCWCIEGAVLSFNDYSKSHMEAVSFLNKAANKDLWAFNDKDDTSFEDVKQLIEKAISLASNR